MFADEDPKAGDELLVESFNLTVRLRVISCFKHVIHTQTTAHALKQLIRELSAVVRYELSRCSIYERPITNEDFSK